jgi:heme-degrading monooxygenase HmoA
MYVYLWEFRVRKESLSEFEDVYGPEGAWVMLFRRAEGYLGSELLRDSRDEARYVTIDRWTSREALESFYARFGAEYEALDRRCEVFTWAETKIGEFESC